MIGSRLGPYEITGKLGEGGMGEVWRATDSRLKREVAIKVLPAAFVADRERLARFEREAQLLAQLHHPNIASIFGLEESDGVRALVMELVEGEDLSTRIARGALPLDESISIARQIAEALEAAHERGIVHRDLKPANVKLRADGTVKVLDFGLAKAMVGSAQPTSGAAVANSPTLMHSPTLTGAHGTQLGMILGTAAYMAPEQARGKAVDKRADVWAFGVLLYEMLAGRRLFAGEEISDVLASVLRQDVDWSALPASTPPRLRHLLARCLDRDPRQRLRDVGEARVELARLESGTVHDAAPASAAVSAAPRRRAAAAWLALPLVAALAAWIAWRAKPEPSVPTVHLSIPLPAGEQVTTAPAISPDGRTVAYVAGRSAATARLYLRRLDETAARPVDSGNAAAWPFFSPDGRAVAFFAAGKLWRAPVDGGSSVVLASASRAFGGSWGPDDRIVYVPTLNAGLWRVPAQGGTPEQLTRPDGDTRGYAHVFPQALPSGDVLFTLWGKVFYSAVLSPATRSWRQVTPTTQRGMPCLYDESGGALLHTDLTAHLLASPWAPRTTALTTADVPVLDDVNWTPGPDRTWFAVSRSGTAVYVPGDPSRRHLVWVDRRGTVTEVPGEPDQINSVSLSWAGDRIAHNGRGALWLRDVASGARVRLLSEVSWAYTGGWLPGDQRVVFSSNMSGDWDLYTLRASGGAPERLLRRPATQHAMAVAPDGSVVFLDYGATTGLDLWVLPPGGGPPRPLVVTPSNESSASVSPDGRYVAYTSDAAGRNDVFAVPFAGGDPVVVSVDGGTGPEWSRDGKELFYRSGDDLVSVEVRSADPLVLGARRKLLDVSAFEPQYFHDFEVSPDGQRFLFVRAEPESRPTRLDVILGWSGDLARRAAAK